MRNTSVMNAEKIRAIGYYIILLSNFILYITCIIYNLAIIDFVENKKPIETSSLFNY